jgi:hypothetical protein
MAKASTAVVRAKVALPADIQKSLQAEVASIQSRIGAPAGNRIKVTQKKTFRMPSGEESPGPIKAVILDFISGNYFYPGVYDPDDITPPDCFALGVEVATMVPHDTAPAKQSDACATCPQNQLLALLAPDAQEDSPIMTLKVSPTGLRAYDGYVASIARSFQTPPVGVITTISFDPTPDYPSLRFGEPEPCPPELLAIAMARRDEAKQILLTPPDTTSLKVVQPPVAKGGKRRAAA